MSKALCCWLWVSFSRIRARTGRVGNASSDASCSAKSLTRPERRSEMAMQVIHGGAEQMSCGRRSEAVAGFVGLGHDIMPLCKSEPRPQVVEVVTADVRDPPTRPRAHHPGHDCRVFDGKVSEDLVDTHPARVHMRLLHGDGQFAVPVERVQDIPDSIRSRKRFGEQW